MEPFSSQILYRHYFLSNEQQVFFDAFLEGEVQTSRSVTGSQVLGWKQKTDFLNSLGVAVIATTTELHLLSGYFQRKATEGVIPLQLPSPEKSRTCWGKTHAQCVDFFTEERLISLRTLSLLFWPSLREDAGFPAATETCDGGFGQAANQSCSNAQQHLTTRSQKSVLRDFPLCQKLRHYFCHQVLHVS